MSQNVLYSQFSTENSQCSYPFPFNPKFENVSFAIDR